MGNNFVRALGGADTVRFLADFPTAFGVNDDLNAGMALANIIHVLRKEPLVDRAMALPQDHLRVAQPLRRDSAHDHEGVPYHALLERYAHGEGSVAAQML